MAWISWLSLFIGFSLGVLFGFCQNRCPAGGNHNWKYMGYEEHECVGYSEPSSYDLGGHYKYLTKCKKYICKKCGKTKYVE